MRSGAEGRVLKGCGVWCCTGQGLRFERERAVEDEDGWAHTEYIIDVSSHISRL